MNDRWLGGTLTNWATALELDQALSAISTICWQPASARGPHQERAAEAQREQIKLQRVLGASGTWAACRTWIFVIDTNKEAIAVKEARKLGIPVAAIIDTNRDPQEVDFPIPGNDDAARARSSCTAT